MRDWLKSLIAEAVGEALAAQHQVTVVKPTTYNIVAGNTERAWAEAQRLEKKRARLNVGLARLG